VPGEATAGHAATAAAAAGPVLSDRLLILSSFPMSNISPFTRKVRAGRGGEGKSRDTSWPGPARCGPTRPGPARPGPARAGEQNEREGVSRSP